MNTYAAIGRGGSSSIVLPAITGVEVTGRGCDDVSAVNQHLPTVAYTRASADVDVYCYTLEIAADKTARAIKLPNNDKLNLLAISLVSDEDPAVPLNLSRAFNRLGITTDGQKLPTGGDPKMTTGFDHFGRSLSANQLGRNLTCGGVRFVLGPAGAANVVQATGQTLNLPDGSFSKIEFLAAAIGDNQPDQKFIVQYTDGTSQTTVQSISDWCMQQHYKGETIAKVTPYGNRANGTSEARMSPKVIAGHAYAVVGYDAKTRAVTLFNPWAREMTGPTVYAYSLALDADKTATKITLPKNGNVNVLAITTADDDGEATPLDLSHTFNRLGITADGRDYKGGFDSVGGSLSSNLLGRNLGCQGVKFTLGASGNLDVVQCGGQTIELPDDEPAKIMLLAAAVNGNQPNQTFVVHYSDGSSKSFKQSISDWLTPQKYPGEMIAKATAYRNHPDNSAKLGKFTLTWDEFSASFGFAGHLSRATSVLKGGK